MSVSLVKAYALTHVVTISVVMWEDYPMWLTNCSVCGVVTIANDSRLAHMARCEHTDAHR